ncbi:MAG: BatD family protein [bacterium]|nr:BatD family protein [bacterium]
MRRRRVRAGWLLGVLLAAGAAHADDGVRLEAALTTTAPVLVGQQATLAVTLSATAPFAGSPIFALPRIPGAVLMQADPHPVLGSATIDGTTWLSQRLELAFYALRPGAFTIPAVTVRFGTTGAPGAAAIPHELATTPVAVTAALPPGVAAGDDVVATTRMTIDEQWTPAPGKARVGDAFTWTVTRTVAGVPAMLLPPLPIGEAGSLAAYPKPPQVTDRSERGDLVGTRIDTITYVCTRADRVTLPGVTFRWWDLGAAELAERTLPAVTFEVAGAPPSPATWAVWAAAMAGLATILWWRRHALAASWRRRRSAWEASEPGRFRALERACRSGGAAAIWSALVAWLALRHAGPGCATVADDLLAHDADPELRRQVTALLDALAAGRTQVGGAALAAALTRHRRTLAQRRPALATLLPDLNPS